MSQLQPPVRRRRSSVGPGLVLVMAIVAWLGALGIAASASEADEPMWDFTMAVVLAVIGAALLIVAVLYDIANRVD